MKKLPLLAVIIQLSVLLSQAQTTITHLTVDHAINPLGIENPIPLLSWQIQSTTKGLTQTAYEIQLWNSPQTTKNPTWTSGKTLSSQSINIPYTGPTLQSGRKYAWHVRIWDDQNHASAWSAKATCQMGLLKPEDWKAQWIGPGYTEDTLRRPSPLLRKTFETHKTIQTATAYITAHGLYEARINGQRIGDAHFTPGWTNYDKRLQYQTYDVTQILKKGSNAIGVTLGDGWYRGIFGQWNYHNNYGSDASLLFQLNIEYTDGTTDTVISDASWKCSTGPIRYADLYNGEFYDAQKEQPNWTTTEYNDGHWTPVAIKIFTKDNLVAALSPPVKEQEHFHPVKILTSPKGEQIIDFGQNLAGWVQFKVRGKKGDSIKLSHAEVLDKAGNFFTGNLREAKAQDIYILNGTKEEQFKPHFTFHGFRYVKVEGINSSLKPEDFEAIALYSDLPPTGAFTCSNPALNQLQHNITWSQKSNFLDIPTDCPQRSERLGWCGDVQIFARTAAFNMQSDNFFAKWLQDLNVDQGADGGMPNVIPNLPGRTLKRKPTGVAGWGDVATVLPWTLYQAYGDTTILKKQYASMKAWVDHIQTLSKNDLWQAGGYGDWLAPEMTDIPYISQCWFAHSTQLLINTAKILGKSDDVVTYSNNLKSIKQAFLKEYITPGGRAISNTQTAYILALYFDMLPQQQQKSAVDRLVDLIHKNKDHLSTGFLGTPFLLPVLSRYGYDTLAYIILLQDTPPSWLYPVKMGATTIWEKWEALHSDGTPDSTSFNHYSYGAVGDWLYRTIAGINNDEEAPGYKHSIIQPRTGGGLTYATGQLNTPYGKLSSQWRWDKDDLLLDLEIPANTNTTVFLNVRNATDITEAGSQTSPAPNLTADKRCTLSLSSGTYHFRIKNWQGPK
jgi:alpha-L-rhamnosidase